MINERLLTLFGGVVSLLLVVALLVPRAETKLKDISIPTSEDRGVVGMAALSQLLNENNIPVISLRQRYHSLQLDLDIPDSGNLIIINQPMVTTPSTNELEALNEWMARGNFALILVAREDKPDWVKRLSIWQKSTILNELGFRFRVGKSGDEDTSESSDENAELSKDEEDRSTTETTQAIENKPDNLSIVSELMDGYQRTESLLRPVLDYPLLKGIDTISSYHSGKPSASLTIEGRQEERYVVPLLERTTDAGVSLWAFRHGEGGGWISSQPDLFGNVTLGKEDNAFLISNMISAALLKDGTVIFDDMHLGLSDLYDPDNFFRDQRLHHTLLLIGLMWLIYLLAYSNRLAPLSEKFIPVSSIAFVEAMAGFFARKTSSGIVASKLLINFYSDVRLFYRQPKSKIDGIKLLRQHASIEATELSQLTLLAEKVFSGKSVNLQQLIRTIDQIKIMMNN